MGRDRPGIVAEVTAVLVELRCNVEDAATSILSGHFAMMLICSAPDELSRAELEESLRPLRATAELELAVWEVDSLAAGSMPTHVLTVYGPDQPGIVHAVAAAVARQGVNICDMTCRLHEEPEPVYVLTMEIELPAGVGREDVEAAVSVAARPLGLEMSLQPLEKEEL